MNEELNLFLLGIGALAEALKEFRDQLLKNGFSRTEAMELTQAFLRETISNTNKNKEDN